MALRHLSLSVGAWNSGREGFLPRSLPLARTKRSEVSKLVERSRRRGEPRRGEARQGRARRRGRERRGGGQGSSRRVLRWRPLAHRTPAPTGASGPTNAAGAGFLGRKGPAGGRQAVQTTGADGVHLLESGRRQREPQIVRSPTSLPPSTGSTSALLRYHLCLGHHNCRDVFTTLSVEFPPKQETPSRSRPWRRSLQPEVDGRDFRRRRTTVQKGAAELVTHAHYNEKELVRERTDHVRHACREFLSQHLRTCENLPPPHVWRWRWHTTWRRRTRRRSPFNGRRAG